MARLAADFGIDVGSPVNRAHPLNNGLIAWYLAFPGVMGGAKWRDLMSPADLTIGNHATLTNIVQGTTSGWNPQSHISGFGSILFDGTNDYVEVASNNSINFGLKNFSVSVWINPVDSGAIERIINKLDASSTNTGWLFDINSNGGSYTQGSVRISLRDGVNSIDVSFVSAISISGWQLITMVVDRNAATLKLFVNGIQISTTQSISTLTGSVSCTVPMDIGILFGQVTGYYKGYITDIRVYNRKISDFEVKALYDISRIGYPEVLRRIRNVWSFAPKIANKTTKLNILTSTKLNVLNSTKLNILLAA